MKEFQSDLWRELSTSRSSMMPATLIMPVPGIGFLVMANDSVTTVHESVVFEYVELKKASGITDATGKPAGEDEKVVVGRDLLSCSVALTRMKNNDPTLESVPAGTIVEFVVTRT